MGVLFRTGENTAASVSWPIYLLVVLPLQLLFGFYKVLILAAKWLIIGIAAASSFLRHRHEENRPPAA